MAHRTFEDGMEGVSRGNDVGVEHLAHVPQRFKVVRLGSLSSTRADDAVVRSLRGSETVVACHLGEEVDGAFGTRAGSSRARLDHRRVERDVGYGVGDESSVRIEVPASSNEVRGRVGAQETADDGGVRDEEGNVSSCFQRVEVLDREGGMGRQERLDEVVVRDDGKGN